METIFLTKNNIKSPSLLIFNSSISSLKSIFYRISGIIFFIFIFILCIFFCYFFSINISNNIYLFSIDKLFVIFTLIFYFFNYFIINLVYTSFYEMQIWLFKFLNKTLMLGQPNILKFNIDFFFYNFNNILFNSYYINLFNVLILSIFLFLIFFIFFHVIYGVMHIFHNKQDMQIFPLKIHKYFLYLFLFLISIFFFLSYISILFIFSKKNQTDLLNSCIVHYASWENPIKVLGLVPTKWLTYGIFPIYKHIAFMEFEEYVSIFDITNYSVIFSTRQLALANAIVSEYKIFYYFFIEPHHDYYADFMGAIHGKRFVTTTTNSYVATWDRYRFLLFCNYYLGQAFFK